MKFLVITLAPTLKENDSYFSYAPYVKEMDIWFQFADEITILSPTEYPYKLLTSGFQRNDFKIVSIPNISFPSLLSLLKSLISLPFIFFKMLSQMAKADHIHLRCPGNIGLLGCIAQIFFPKKKKTAKYAGNWDPNSNQPFSYKLQKWILSNTFLTKNMQVLVYGNWPNQSKNIMPFFTASYTNEKIALSEMRSFNEPYKFLFVGSLSSGKQPLYALRLVVGLFKKGIKCSLDFYGDGPEMEVLKKYISENNLQNFVKLHGNQTSETVEKAYKESQFLILPSKSEGWPKVVAEAMFWGVIPITSKVSCIPWMLDFGTRGILLTDDFEKDKKLILNSIKDVSELNVISENAKKWSQHYTLDYFESELKKLIV